MPKAPVTRINGAFQIQADSVGNPNNATNYNGFYAPQLTTTQRNAIPTNTLQNGAIIYNTTTSTFQVYQNGAWTNISTSSNSNALVAPSNNADPVAANSAAGMIYFDTANGANTFRTCSNVANGAATWGTAYVSPGTDTTIGSNLVLQSVAGDPVAANSAAGMIYFDTANGANTFRTCSNVANGAATWGTVATGITNTTVGVSTLVSANGASNVTVNTGYVTANSNIFLQTQGTIGTGNSGNVRVSATTPNTSFVITSSNNADTSQIRWLIINP